MRECVKCGKEISGKSTKIYCGVACRKAAQRSRKQQGKITAKQAITTAERKDINYIARVSPEAAEKLKRIHALHGRDVFLLALDATYIATVDAQTVPI